MGEHRNEETLPSPETWIKTPAISDSDTEGQGLLRPAFPTEERPSYISHPAVPDDDTASHGYTHPAAPDDFRAANLRTPAIPGREDTEGQGHGHPAVDQQDTAGHWYGRAAVPADESGGSYIKAPALPGDDTEGQIIQSGGKEPTRDAEPVNFSARSDTRGQIYRNSATPTDDAGTEGNSLYVAHAIEPESAPAPSDDPTEDTGGHSLHWGS